MTPVYSRRCRSSIHDPRSLDARPRSMHDVKAFSHAAEEARHWKDQVEEMRAALHEAESGLQEFMESSKGLEAEMEADMTAANKRAEALEAENEHLRADVEEWRSKYQKSMGEHSRTLADLQHELTKLRETHDVYKARLRDMEVDNDTLENAERMINSSLKDMETRYHQAMERTVLLETELEDKARLETENQRLKDELRELREEVAVLQRSEEPRQDQGELTLSDLVVVKPRPDRTSDAVSPLERLREHMQQLQQRLQRAQTAGVTSTHLQRYHWQRSSIPRPRSSMSASGSAGAPASPAAWRAPTPSRPETPADRRPGSSIPVPVGGLSRSQSRNRPPSRLVQEVQQSPVGPVPFEFMEHDPAASPMRQSSLGRRRSLGGSSLSGIPLPSRTPSRPPSALRSPTKVPRPISPSKRSSAMSPTPWR